MSASGHQAADHDVVALVASYGGLPAHMAILGALPAEFPAPILLVQHRHPKADFVVQILSRCTELSVTSARVGDVPTPGSVHVLPPDRQVTLDADGRFCSTPADRCLGDPLLESMALVHGDRAIAVVLTGRLSDGAAGVRAVKSRGGRVIVQDEASAEAPGMPAAARATGCADLVLPLPLIAPALVSLTTVARRSGTASRAFGAQESLAPVIP